VVKEKEAKVAKMVAKEDAVRAPKEERTVAKEKEKAKDPREEREEREEPREEPRW